MSEYLHWLFGERLIDGVSRSVAWSHDSFQRLNRNEDGIADLIEGAYDGPTSGIASMFSRARIEVRAYDEGASKRLGDIFRLPEGNTVRAIITPDCDLMVRGDGARVKNPLTVAGVLKKFDDPTASIADFLLLGDVAYSIDWNPKDIAAIDFAEMKMDYVGTLRPLYAQELQRSVLSDLSRVGVAVAPVIGFTARAAVYLNAIKIKGKGEKTFCNPASRKLDLGLGNKANCTVMPSRRDGDPATLIFHREFVHSLLKALHVADRQDLAEGVGDCLEAALAARPQSDLFDEFCRQGIQSGTTNTSKMLVSLGGGPKSGASAPWCHIVVETRDVGEPLAP